MSFSCFNWCKVSCSSTLFQNWTNVPLQRTNMSVKLLFFLILCQREWYNCTYEMFKLYLNPLTANWWEMALAKSPSCFQSLLKLCQWLCFICDRRENRPSHCPRLTPGEARLEFTMCRINPVQFVVLLQKADFNQYVSCCGSYTTENLIIHWMRDP